MSIKDKIMDLFITTDENGNKYYPSGYLSAIEEASNLAQARENELQARINVLEQALRNVKALRNHDFIVNGLPVGLAYSVSDVNEIIDKALA